LARKNIFEIIAENNDIEDDIKRIDKLSKMLSISNGIENYSLVEFVDEYCFKNWSYGKYFIDLQDFIDTLGLNFSDINDYLNRVELFYNLWKIADKYLNEDSEYKYYNNFTTLHDIMFKVLAQLNHKIYYDEKEEKALVIEDKPEVTSVAEIVDDNLSMDVIRYNHHSLKGDIEKKKTILLKFANDLESKRKLLDQKDKDLATNIFSLLNNMNLRHNNCTEGDKCYNEVVAQMTDEELENWYDELYQMILLAYLELDNIDRNRRVEELRKRYSKKGK